MSKEEQNKAVVGRWFSEFWGKKEGRRPSGRTRRPCLQKDSPSFCGIVTIEPGNPCVKHYRIITGCLLIASYAFGQSANPFRTEAILYSPKGGSSQSGRSNADRGLRF